MTIVGGGTAGWMTAAALARHLRRERVSIRLVESDEIGTVGVGESTIPPIISFLRSLGVNEDEFVARTGATYKLGIQFVDWHSIGSRYFHSFGKIGRPIAGLPFYQAFLKLAGMRLSGSLAEYVPCAVASVAGRFSPRIATTSKAGTFSYALHLDAKRFAEFLRGYAEARGVERIEGKVDKVSLDPENGSVCELSLVDGRAVDGEIFIDCSGARAILLSQALSVPHVSWRAMLPCDRAIVVPSEALNPTPLFTRATADLAGWRWRIPLQHRSGNGYVFSSDFLDRDQAAEALLRGLDGRAQDEPRELRFATGHRARFWDRNVVAIGLSAGFLEPLESTSIHLIQTGIAALLSLFPDSVTDPQLRNEYNRRMSEAFEQVRDFVVLHYKATARTDSDFWRALAASEMPDSLATRIDLFRSTGSMLNREDELFSVDNWVQVLLGQGVAPRRYNPLVDSLNLDDLRSAFNNLRANLQNAVASMPQHEDQLASLHSAWERSRGQGSQAAHDHRASLA